jgi:hypothetical protein
MTACKANAKSAPCAKVADSIERVQSDILQNKGKKSVGFVGSTIE